jgi:hypothetical protein
MSLFTDEFKKFDLIGVYFLSLKHVAWDVLWGAGIASIIYWGLWWFYTAPPWWVTFIYGLALVFFAGYYLWRADHIRLIPRFGVEHTVVIQDTPVMNAATGHPLGTSSYFQLQPRCLTDAPIQNCWGHLTGICRWNERHHTWTELESETMILEWSHGGTGITLFPRAERRLNLFQIQHTGNYRIHPLVNPFPARFNTAIFDDLPGMNLLRFDVRITGDDCTPEVFHVRVKTSDDPSRPITEIVFPEP